MMPSIWELSTWVLQLVSLQELFFDTGSEYLAITSALCDDKTSGNFKFKKYDPLSGSFVQRD